MPKPHPSSLPHGPSGHHAVPAARPGWLAGDPARALMAVEQRALIPSITGVFGRAGLYLRPCASAPADLSGNMLLSVLRLHGDGEQFDGDLRCEGWRLPVSDDSMSLVYVLHALDCQEDPGALLAEIARVLAPEGMLVLVGLNPFSPWLLHWIGRGPRLRAAGPMRARIAQHGLQVYRRTGLGPVWPGASALQRCVDGNGADWFAPLRAGYALLARKRRGGFTPLPLATPRPAALQLKPFPHAGCVRARHQQPQG